MTERRVYNDDLAAFLTHFLLLSLLVCSFLSLCDCGRLCRLSQPKVNQVFLLVSTCLKRRKITQRGSIGYLQIVGVIMSLDSCVGCGRVVCFGVAVVRLALYFRVTVVSD